MPRPPVTNIASSVRARLLTIARNSGRDFDAVMLQYLQERFLYRLAQTPYSINIQRNETARHAKGHNGL